MALMEALAPPSVLQAAPALAVGRHGARSDSSTFAGSHFVGPPGVMSAAVAVTCLASRRGARTALAAKAKKGKRSEAAARAMEALAAYEQKPAEQAEKKKKKNRRNQATMQDQEREKQKLEKLMEKDVEAPLPKAEEKIEKPVKEEPVLKPKAEEKPVEKPETQEPVLKPKAEEKPVEKPETQVPDVTPMTEKEPVLKEKPAALQPKETQTQAQAKKPSYFDDLLDVMAETPETDERMALPPPLEVDSDPFAVIAKEHQEHERSNGRRKIAARKKEAVDPKKYYDEKGMQDKADEWLLLNPEEEEEEEEEEVVIKRKRGPEDKVDFSFLQKGDVEGEITVGIREVAVRLGGRMVLQDASWTVKTGERLALVGANGCGKTTQLRVLTGDILPESGEVVKSHAKCKMAVLEQSFVDDLNPKNTLKEELMGAVPTVEAISQEMEEVEAELAANPEDEQEIMRLSNRLSELTDMKEDYKVDKVKEILKLVAKQVGFLEEDMDRPVNLFSGGWKVRIGVCKILMMSPDVLLLDEPTNHLDLEAVEWLEKFLRTQDLPMVIVTHDREFMNRVCTRVVETVEGMTYSYNGNYTDFVRAKEEKMTDWKKKWDLQEKKRKQLEDYIKQNRGVQSLAKARARREKDLEELLETGIDPPPSFVKRINFRFPEPPKDHRGGAKNEILAELRRVSHGYGTEDDEEYELLKDCDFMVTPGDKIGIVGGNGKGKSTLLRLLMGQERPRDGGTIRMADPEMTGFFAQHQADLLPMEKTGWEVIKEANEILMDDKKLMEIMKKFRFRGDRAHVQIANLSGGEKARLAIVRMMLIPSRMLIFDEPTNHLDVPMKETLEMALREFEGAVVMVSHDRWFLSQTCKKIVEIHDGKVTIYDGDFRFYMDSNNDIRRTIEAHYTGIDGLIESVPASLEERRKKERKGLRKNQLKKRQQERQELLNSGFLSNREWRR